MNNKSIMVGFCCFLHASCSDLSYEPKSLRDCTILFEEIPRVGERRILMVNQARLGEEIHVSNSLCSGFQDGVQLDANARSQLAHLIGVDDEGGILVGIYVIDVTVHSKVNSMPPPQVQVEQIEGINALVAEIDFDELASIFEH